jgi:hypothetical protein
MAIVMRLDRYRGQITGDWIVTETGEVQRTRVAPVDRAWARDPRDPRLRPDRGRRAEAAYDRSRLIRQVLHFGGIASHS